MTDAVENVNWVEARHECSAQSAMIRLLHVVEADVSQMQSFGQLRRPFHGLRCDRTTGNGFLVHVVWDLGGVFESEGVAFELDGDLIRVRHRREVPTDRILFSVRPTVSADGKCRLEHTDTGQLMEFWQVSKAALEPMFFDG
jgi:hypothetical protein